MPETGVCMEDKYVLPSTIDIGEDAYNQRTAFHYEPLIALKVAHFICMFSAVEISLPSILSEITGMNSTTCEAVIGTHKGLSSRMELIDAALKQTDLSPELNSYFETLLALIKNMISRRNMYCHSLYKTTPIPGQLMMIGYRMDWKTKTKEEILTVEAIEKDLVSIQQLNFSIFCLCKDTVRQAPRRK